MAIKRILIVEDEETSRRVIKLALECEGRELLFAREGDEAVRIAREKKPSLIVMDMMIPGMDGFGATRAIKGNDATKNIPVVALTARTNIYDRERALELGCDDYLTKPFRINDLRTRLGRYLS